MTTADKDNVLLEWPMNISGSTSAFMTHYYQRQNGLLTQIRPLSSTEDCDKCIILPILFELYVPMYTTLDHNESNFTIEGYESSCCLPVFFECTKGTGRSKAICIHYLGDRNNNIPEPSFRWSHCIERDDIVTDDPKQMINILFENNDHDVPKEFIIV